MDFILKVSSKDEGFMQWKGNKIAVVAVLLLLMLDYISGVIILAASDIICNLWNYNSQVFPVELNSLSLSLATPSPPFINI